ncbi:hypothetical protein VHEMI01647 [[Torrubiella] hemipterigena]|uniref:Glutathione S-transferase n=1 Tax=[Torrubiella] hemipterigena TaxID=1531966 RepID=A0A0A1STM3_9HYPO|nr:hypothetical protein VHEMI01647 [[Torrubiella] hemipterigena]
MFRKPLIASIYTSPSRLFHTSVANKMLQVWGRRTSSNVQAVLWCLAELNVPYTQYDIGHRFGGNNTPEYLAMNPNGLVPVIRDGDDEPLFESSAIVRYLAAKYGSDAFWPKDPAKRAQVDKWAEWAKTNVFLGFTAPIFWPVVRTPKSKQNPEQIRGAIASLDKFLDIAETELSKKTFLAGEEFTLADIQLGHALFRYFDIDIERKKRPNLERYYETLKGRKAFQDMVMVSYDELRAKEE